MMMFRWRGCLSADPKHKRALVCVVVAVLAFAAFVAFVPLVKFADPLSYVLYSSEGALLNARVADDGQWRIPPGSTVPPKFATAIVMREDRRFYSHWGVDPLAGGRAVWLNLRHGQIKSGASTITMQVVRLSRKNQPRTIAEKLVEMALAVRLELSHSKADILALYAAYAPFGGNVVGLEAAAWRYFGRQASDLSWSEASVLATLPQSPALIHPNRNRSILLNKRNDLLQRLHANEVLNDTAYQLATKEPLPAAPKPLPQNALHAASHFAKQAKSSPRSTLSKNLQLQVEDIASRHATTLAANHIYNLGVLVLDVETGKALAYVGNAPLPKDGRERGEYVDMVTSRRSTGSILKPLLYAAAIDNGEILPHELLLDVPALTRGFSPENFSRTYEGAVDAATALSHSLNVPAADLLNRYGVDQFAAFLRAMGMTTLNRDASDYGLSLVLGGAEGTLWELTGIYATLARLAVQQTATRSLFFPPHIVFNAPKRPVSLQQPPLSAGAAYLTLKAMLEVERPGAEAGWRHYVQPRHVAWKTGTSAGHRDGWAIGVSRRFAVGVWVGNADGEGRPGLTGLSVASPVLFDVFSLLDTAEDDFFRAPVGLVSVPVCTHSGQRATSHCASTRIEMVPKASLHAGSCQYCQTISVDATRVYRVDSSCADVATMRQEKRFVLSPVAEKFYRLHHADYVPLPPWKPDCVKSGGASQPLFAIVYPKANSVISIPKELDGTRGASVFEAAHRKPHSILYWHLDATYLGKTEDLHQMALQPSVGAHVLTVVDEAGSRIERRFSVR